MIFYIFKRKVSQKAHAHSYSYSTIKHLQISMNLRKYVFFNFYFFDRSVVPKYKICFICFDKKHCNKQYKMFSLQLIRQKFEIVFMMALKQIHLTKLILFFDDLKIFFIQYFLQIFCWIFQFFQTFAVYEKSLNWAPYSYIIISCFCGISRLTF